MHANSTCMMSAQIGKQMSKLEHLLIGLYTSTICEISHWWQPSGVPTEYYIDIDFLKDILFGSNLITCQLDCFILWLQTNIIQYVYRFLRLCHTMGTAGVCILSQSLSINLLTMMINPFFTNGYHSIRSPSQAFGWPNVGFGWRAIPFQDSWSSTWDFCTTNPPQCSLGTPTPSSHHGRTYSTHHADYHDDPAPRHHDAHDVDKDFNLCWRGERDFWLKFPNIPRSVLSWIDFSYLWWRRRTASTIICMMHHLILEPVFEFHKEIQALIVWNI